MIWLVIISLGAALLRLGEKIVDAGKVEELEGYFEEMYPDGVDSVTAINDDLWFNDEEILDYLGIADEEEDEEEDEEI